MRNVELWRFYKLLSSTRVRTKSSTPNLTKNKKHIGKKKRCQGIEYYKPYYVHKINAHQHRSPTSVVSPCHGPVPSYFSHFSCFSGHTVTGCFSNSSTSYAPLFAPLVLSVSTSRHTFFFQIVYPLLKYHIFYSSDRILKGSSIRCPPPVPPWPI